MGGERSRTNFLLQRGSWSCISRLLFPFAYHPCTFSSLTTTLPTGPDPVSSPILSTNISPCSPTPRTRWQTREGTRQAVTASEDFEPLCFNLPPDASVSACPSPPEQRASEVPLADAEAEASESPAPSSARAAAPALPGYLEHKVARGPA